MSATDQSASAVGSEIVPLDRMVRMEFHVEAVLDMVAQVSDTAQLPGDKSVQGMLVLYGRLIAPCPDFVLRTAH